MISFLSPQLSDKIWVNQLLSYSDYPGCEYSFGNIFLWHKEYELKIARYKDFLLFRSEGKTPSYCFPAGKGDFREAIQLLKQEADNEQIPLRLYGVTLDNISVLEELYPSKFEVKPYRHGFDYIYNSENLINLSGRKYHSKRNHISAFKKNNNWSYENIDENNIEECIAMTEAWIEENQGKMDNGGLSEIHAVCRAFKYFFDLDFIGGAIRVNNKIIAYTIGERLNSDTFCIHIEKAFSNVNGAYAIINNEFASRNLGNYRRINREEDMGVEGLRKAKLSYHPDILLEKHTAVYGGE